MWCLISAKVVTEHVVKERLNSFNFFRHQFFLTKV